jgi:hypothetical protein
MADKPDIRSFCNEFKPSYSAAWQRERLTGEALCEDCFCEWQTKAFARS